MKYILQARFNISTLKICDSDDIRFYTIIHHVSLIIFKPVELKEKEIIGNRARN